MYDPCLDKWSEPLEILLSETMFQDWISSYLRLLQMSQ